jgi:photosystem II stability/assembly factor-like uncharacterized protein
MRRLLRSPVTLIAVSLLWQGFAAAQDRTCWIRDGSSPAPSLVFLLCEQGSLLVTADNGATWSPRDTKIQGHLRSIDFIDAAHAFAVGDDGLLIATADGGKTWERRKIDARENLAAIQFIGPSGWVVGFDGVVLHTADSGLTWTRQETGTKESLESVFFLDPDHGWAAGWAGTILRTVDGGKSWKMIRADAASWSLSSVYFKDANNGWIVGFSGQILRSTDAGLTWKALKSPVNTWLSSVTFDSANHGWITADDSLLVSEDGGESWREVKIEDRLFLSQFVPVHGELWALGQLGVLRHSGNGTAWKRIESLVADDPARDSPTAR